MGPFLLATFLSAALLFQVQPIIARYILPWYGGSPSLWTACMMFFQAALLLGYLYAHLLGQRVPEKHQPIVHFALLALSMLLLPIGPPESWIPAVVGWPGIEIMMLLAISVGVPFVLIAASGPLLQRWYAGVYPSRSPFRLYALSNLGSLVGLLTYPFLIEPQFSLSSQTTAWSIAYAVLVVLFVFCGLAYRRQGLGAWSSTPEHRPLTLADRLLWVSLAACGSTVLLAITNQICQDVAVVPFLWILPLSLYLLTFIICFERDAWYSRKVWWPLLAIAVVLVVELMFEEFTLDTTTLLNQFGIYSFTLLACCMICHGELARSRSAVPQLTTFYLYVALGGVLGGVFVNIVAPLIFTGFWELHVCLVATVLLAGVCAARDGPSFSKRRRRLAFAAAWSVLVAALSVLMVMQVQSGRVDSIHVTRGFFGVLYVDEWDAGTSEHERHLYHGKIRHGLQLLSPQMQRWPTAYYGVDSGVGAAIRQHPRRFSPDPRNRALNIGVVGMGVATLSAYGREHDSIRYYEINPQVLEIAHEYFRYVQNGKAATTVVLGDARLSMRYELAETGSNDFDVLVLDAFSSDSVPVHLLTEEAFDLYSRHLRQDGILAIHTTNQFVDLSPVVRASGDRLGMQTVLVSGAAERQYEEANDWVLITSNRDFLGSRSLRALRTPWPEQSMRTVHWTDDFSNLFDVISWRD